MTKPSPSPLFDDVFAILREELGGAARAEYGKRLLPMLAEQLTAEFGKGFDASNLRYK